MQYSYVENNPDTHPNWFDIRKSFGKQLLFFTSCANLMYCFDLQYAIMPLYKSLENNSYKSLKKLNLITICMVTTVFLITSIFGFLTAPVDPPELLIFRISITKSDLAMTIAMMLMCICIIGEICINFNTIRICFFQILRQSEDFTTKE